MHTKSLPTCETLLTAFPELFTQCIGDRNATLLAVRSPEQGDDGSIVFCSQPKAIPLALASQASVLVVSAKAASGLENRRGNKTLLISSNVERAMAEVIKCYFLKTPYRDRSTTGIHPSAVLHETVQLGAGVRIGPHAVIAANVSLGANVFIGANAVVEADAKIGDNSVLHPLVYIGHHTEIGPHCEILPNTTIGKEGFGYAHDHKGNHYRIPHQGRVILEADVHIGSSCTIDRGTFGETRIGAGTKIDNQVHIAHNCRIGRNCLLTSGFAMAGSSTIGDNFVTGGGSLVTGHIQIVDNVHIAGNSVVSKSMDKPGQYGGFPLVPLQKNIKIRAALVHLPEMRKQVALLMKKIFPDMSTDTEKTEE